MGKHHLSITVDPELVERAKGYGFNLSAWVERSLTEELRILERARRRKLK